MVVKMPTSLYVFEFKINGSAQDALQQIDSNRYAIPYETEGRKIVKVGVKFNTETRIPEDWVVE